MEEIKNWLESKDKDYQIGVHLYLKHGKNRALANTFLKKESNYTKEKLEYELGKLFVAPIKPVPAPRKSKPKKDTPAESEATTGHTKTSEPFETKDAILNSLKNQRAAVSTKISMNSNKLSNASDEESKKIIADNDAYQEELKQINFKINHLETKGSLPVENEAPKEKPLPTDKADIQKELGYARIRRSKAKNALDRAGKNSPKGKKAKAKFDKEDKLVKELEEALK